MKEKPGAIIGLLCSLSMLIACSTGNQPTQEFSEQVLIEQATAKNVTVSIEDVISPVILANDALINREESHLAPASNSSSPSPQPTLPANSDSNQKESQAPPQAAIDACDDLSQEDSCSFDSPNGIIEGSCTLIQDSLACTPPDSPGGSGQP